MTLFIYTLVIQAIASTVFVLIKKGQKRSKVYIPVKTKVNQKGQK